MSELGMPTPKQARENIDHARGRRVDIAKTMLRKAVAEAMNTGRRKINVGNALNPPPTDYELYGLRGQRTTLGTQRCVQEPDTYADVALEAAQRVGDEIRGLGWYSVSASMLSIEWSYPPEVAP